MMSGSSRLISRANFHAVERSASERGASGMRSSPSATRLRSSPSGCATSVARCPIARRPLTVSRTWFCPPLQLRAVSTCRENIDLGTRLKEQGSRNKAQGTRNKEQGSRLRLAPCSLRVVKFPEFRVLHADVIAVQRGDHESGNAVEDAALRDVVAKKGERRMAGDLEQAGAAAGLVHLPGGV